jgi:hypothetical protein
MTAARGLTTRRLVGALTPRDGVARRHDNCMDRLEQPPIATEAPALRTQERDYAWVDAAAKAAGRLALH